MATVQNPNDDQVNPQSPNQPTTGATSAVGTSTGGAAASKAPVSPVSQNQAPTQGYTDVASYLNANQQGGAQIGQNVAQNLTNQYTTAKQGIDTSTSAANQAVSQGYTPENTQLIKQVAANPTDAASNQGQLGAFQAQLNDQYTGPSSYADLGTQQGNVANAQQYGQLLNTPGGNNVLIQQVENQANPGQTGQGINALDTLLFSGNPNAVGQAQTAAAPLNTLGDYLNQQATEVQGNITAGQANASQAAQDALNAFTGQTGTLTNLNQNINKITAQDLTQAQAQEALAAQAIGKAGTNQITDPATLAALGLTSQQAQTLAQAVQTANNPGYMTAPNFGVQAQGAGITNLNSYLNQQNPQTMINPDTVATPEQYQEMAAIQQLLGGQMPKGATINTLNANLAGTYNPANLNQFNYNAALADLGNYTTQAQQAAQNQANQESAMALAQHNAGGGGLFGGIMNNPIAQYLANPITQVPAEINAVKKV